MNRSWISQAPYARFKVRFPDLSFVVRFGAVNPTKAALFKADLFLIKHDYCLINYLK